MDIKRKVFSKVSVDGELRLFSTTEVQKEEPKKSSTKSKLLKTAAILGTGAATAYGTKKLLDKLGKSRAWKKEAVKGRQKKQLLFDVLNTPFPKEEYRNSLETAAKGIKKASAAAAGLVGAGAAAAGIAAGKSIKNKIEKNKKEKEEK